MALRKKVNVYEAFIEGAKDGFGIAIKIIPYLVAILVSIGVFRASGAMDWMIEGFRYFFSLFLENTEFVHGLPTALMKPLSGSGARGMMLDAFATHGVDSFVGKLTATLQGATDTTFYIIAVYFGSVGIRKTRYAIKAGLLADLAGVIAGIVVATIWFGGAVQPDKMSPKETVVTFSENWSSTIETDLINPNCILSDQTSDKIEYQTAVEKYSMLKIKSVKHNKNDKAVYVKLQTESGVNSFKLVVEREKIQSIQLMGNFED